LFKRAENEDVAQALLNLAEDARAKLKAAFSIEPEFDPMVLERLKAMSKIIGNRPITVSPELIEWAEVRDYPYPSGSASTRGWIARNAVLDGPRF
jgi:hypothetical protein